MTDQGYIKLFRSIEGWEWIDDPVMFYFWCRILIMANWEETKYRGSVVERGSFLTSYRSLAETLKLSLRQVRTCVDRLKQCGQIIVKSTHFPTQFATQVIICNYEIYQDVEHSERHSSRQTSDTVATQFGTSPSPTPPSSLKEEEKKEVDTKVSPKKENIDYQFVLNLWNSYAKRNVPKIKAVSQARKEKVKLRVAEMGGWEHARGTLEECFRKISESDFATGATGRWAANFDWFFENEKNWLKVLEGNYDNRKEKTQLEQLAENITKAHEYYGQRYGYGGASAYGDPAGSRQDSPDEQ